MELAREKERETWLTAKMDSSHGGDYRPFRQITRDRKIQSLLTPMGCTCVTCMEPALCVCRYMLEIETGGIRLLLDI